MDDRTSVIGTIPFNESENNLSAVTKKLLGLLKEIDGICEQQNIPYFLEGYTALAAYRDHSLPVSLINPVISMFAADIEKFIYGFKQKQDSNRYLEYMGESPNFPNFVLHYGDVNTTYCDPVLVHLAQNYGLHITIKPLRRSNIEGLRYRLIYGLESAWESANITKSVSFKRIVSTVGTRAVCLLFGYRRYASWLFRRLIEVSSDKEGALYTKVLWERIKVENEFFYTRSTEVILNGISLKMSGYPERYLDAHFKDWKHRIIFPESDASKCFVSAYVPFNKIGSYFEKEWKEKQWKLMERKRSLVSKRDCYARENAYVWDKVCFTGSRFYYWSMLMPQKETILRLFDQRRDAEIRGIMEPYLKDLRASIKRGIPICFDEDILNIALYLLYRGKNSLEIKKVKDEIPDEYLQPINIEIF